MRGPGLEVVGTVSDKDTGKPIAGAVVQTASPIGNPLRFLRARTDPAGRYRLTSLPLNTEILASVPAGPAYLQSVEHLSDQPADAPIGIEKIRGLKASMPGSYRARPHYFNPKNYNAVVGIDPKPGDESITADLQLDRGRTVKGSLQGPGGEPVSGALHHRRGRLLPAMVAPAARIGRV